ncbi:ABC transporter substrate-binding protein [Actinophytocola xanthii]|uniref:ABC transporter substrate-binding protein n=1 Tax=Actinophytocola xanthii TaxID=1912961 RepID=A0A1Q8CE55_9PSEU|nr:spermidine/putrescine ABC transporter substrate-binding protein [Actinophytocola xanthii]OLF12570.1 ABC transporter substrate-binding protein [Actinophytocola xanthii]
MRTRRLSPEAAAVLDATWSRRTVLRGLLTAGAAVGAGSMLSACGMRGTRQSPDSCRSTDESADDPRLTISNWPLYIDVDENDESRRPTLDAFVASTGIDVTYQEDVNDNNEFFGKVRNQLSACQPVDRDIMVLTDWMAARMIRLGWVQKLDRSALPNVEANLLDSLRGRSWDPGTDYAVPWQTGLAGIAYNGTVAKEVRTVEELLTRPDLHGKVTCLSEMRDTMGLIMLSMGHDPADFTEDQFDEALTTLQVAVDSGQIRRFTGNDYAQELARGDIAACVGWSGDVIQLNFTDENIRFVTPESGVMLWSDNMQVPNRATHRANAQEWINYYYEPAVAAELAAYVNYICPVQGAQAEMEKIDPELAANPLIFPDESVLSTAKVFMALNEAQERIFEQKFQQVIGA